MNDPIATFAEGLRQTSLLELMAVSLALLYLILAIKENLWCWAAAAGSTVLYLYLFFSVGLYAESALQIYYLAMAGFGFSQWRSLESQQGLKPKKVIIRWNLTQHALALSLIGLATLVLAWGLLQTDSQAPFLDAFTTCGAFVSSYMVTQKVLENWIYWLVIDSASIVLYLERSLYFTAMLFMLYVVLVAIGYWHWHRTFHDPSRNIPSC